MKIPKVILHTDNPELAKDIVCEQHPDLEVTTCASNDALAELLRDTQAEVLYSIRFSNEPPFPRQSLIESAHLKWVSVGGSGVNHLMPWRPDQLTVTNAAGVAAEMMAQYALGAMLHFSLGFPGFRSAQERREWVNGRVEPIDGKTVLIIGMGKTGFAVANLCKAMGMTTIGARTSPEPTPLFDEVHHFEKLPTLWCRADFIVVCVPLLDTTRGLLGAHAFDAMKPNAVLIDVSRGTVIDEAALLQALETKRIRGAALDVFKTEPLPKAHPIWGYDNVIVTPHCSSVYDGWDLKSVQMFVENLSRYRSGAPLENVVDPKRGY